MTHATKAKPKPRTATDPPTTAAGKPVELIDRLLLAMIDNAKDPAIKDWATKLLADGPCGQK